MHKEVEKAVELHNAHARSEYAAKRRNQELMTALGRLTPTQLEEYARLTGGTGSRG